MATRTIVTSQPDVACDVCGRRLLRGEQPDAFVVAGARRLVCELCAPRALHDGWQRESERAAVTLPPPRSRRGRSLFARLLGGKSPPRHTEADDAMTFVSDADEGFASPVAPWTEQEPFDYLAGAEPNARSAHAPPVRAAPIPEASSQAVDSSGARDGLAPPEVDPAVLEEALAAFNASGHPRRIAGVARSLGAPEVSVHPAEHARSVIVIVVAWELCWYRYEVDLDELELQARATAQGTELDELAREDRIANAIADSSGKLTI